MRKIIIGVMGGGSVTDSDAADAYELGQLIARQGWVLLNGGRRAGIMDAAAKGAVAMRVSKSKVSFFILLS